MQWLAGRNITPYMRTRDSIHRKNSPFFGPERFTYQPESNSYRCPAGQQLNYGGAQHAEPHLCLQRDSQKVRWLWAQSPMHQRSVSLSCRRTRPATRSGVGEHARVCPGATGKKKGGSPVGRTQESDRTATLARCRKDIPITDFFNRHVWLRQSSTVTTCFLSSPYVRLLVSHFSFDTSFELL